MASSTLMKIVLPVLLAICIFGSTVNGEDAYVNATTLPKSILVNTTINGQALLPYAGSVLRHDLDTLTVSWKLNASFAGNDTAYKSVFIKLCFGAVSAVDRPWRKNNDNLMKSKTCKYAIKRQPYTPEGSTVEYKIPDTVPTAFYFVRVFVLNTTDPEAVPGAHAVAVGSSTNATRTANLFAIEGFTGRGTAITVATIIFSILSYVLLFGFFALERVMKKNS